jgi:hypothetical protein
MRRLDYRDEKSGKVLSEIDISVMLSGLNNHLGEALLNLQECAVRLQILEQIIRKVEDQAGRSMWPTDDISRERVAEIFAKTLSITRHFLGKPF